MYKEKKILIEGRRGIENKQMKELEESGSLRGNLSAEKQLALISICTDLKAAVEGATFIQVSKCLTTPSKQRKMKVLCCRWTFNKSSTP
uniref:Uncharacterized protein n=1 Tax=Pavo cristatus TaxID=9049 RepID=A0A8C9FTH2_PAVCR